MWKVSNWSNCSPYKLLNSPTFTEIYFGSCDGAGPTQHTRVFSSSPSSGLVCPLCSSLSLYFTMWKPLTILTFHITHLILTEYKNKYKFCILLYHVKGWIRETNVTLWAKVQICCNPTATVALITIELPYYSSCAAGFIHNKNHRDSSTALRTDMDYHKYSHWVCCFYWQTGLQGHGYWQTCRQQSNQTSRSFIDVFFLSGRSDACVILLWVTKEREDIKSGEKAQMNQESRLNVIWKMWHYSFYPMRFECKT